MKLTVTKVSPADSTEQNLSEANSRSASQKNPLPDISLYHFQKLTTGR
jgi:hypothetical protein